MPFIGELWKAKPSFSTLEGDRLAAVESRPQGRAMTPEETRTYIRGSLVSDPDNPALQAPQSPSETLRCSPNQYHIFQPLLLVVAVQNQYLNLRHY